MSLKDEVGKSETTIKYEFTPEQIKAAIADSLSIPVDEIRVDYVIEEVGGDFLDRYRGNDEVTKIRVTHTPKQ